MAKQEREMGKREDEFLQIAKFLFCLLDDIDTAGDIAKEDHELYRSLVAKAHLKRWHTGIKTNGYELDFSRAESPAQRDTYARDNSLKGGMSIPQGRGNSIASSASAKPKAEPPITPENSNG